MKHPTHRKKHMIELIEIVDHRAFGEMVAGWSKDPTTAPKTIEDLRAKTAGILTIPARITKVKFVETDLSTFVVRLPNKEMVAEAVARFETMDTAKDYPMPGFYAFKDHEDTPTALEVLYDRIADYTVGQCQ